MERDFAGGHSNSVCMLRSNWELVWHQSAWNAGSCSPFRCLFLLFQYSSWNLIFLGRLVQTWVAIWQVQQHNFSASRQIEKLNVQILKTFSYVLLYRIQNIIPSLLTVQDVKRGCCISTPIYRKTFNLTLILLMIQRTEQAGSSNLSMSLVSPGKVAPMFFLWKQVRFQWWKRGDSLLLNILLWVAQRIDSEFLEY